MSPLKSLFLTFATRLFCEKKSACGVCFACIQIKKQTHPDIEWLCPEKIGHPIKIERVRELQDNAWAPPQLAPYRLIYSSPAYALNTFALNALLKLLEEPPSHLKFILCSDHRRLPNTLSSRCVSYFFYSEKNALIDEYWLIDPESERMALYQQREVLYATLNALLLKQTSVFEVVDVYLKYEIQDIVWFLYTIVSVLITACLDETRMQNHGAGFLALLKTVQTHRSIYFLHYQLKAIYVMLSALQDHAALNPRLLLERFFYDWS